MNRDCTGDFFMIKECPALLYRCFYDGSISASLTNGDHCPRCNRIIDGEKHGQLATVAVPFVNMPRFGLVELPTGELSNAKAVPVPRGVVGG